MSDKGFHTVPSMHGDEGLQGDEDKGAEDIPGTDVIVHTASMFLQTEHKCTDSTEQMVANKLIRCINGIFHPCVLDKKSVFNLHSTTTQEQDGAALVQMGCICCQCVIIV